jgi:integrase/recombinase XerD
MTSAIVRVSPRQLSQVGFDGFPGIIASAGDQARWRFLEFFTANIRNKNTRMAYLRAILPFLTWCEGRDIRDFKDIKPIVVAVYIEQHPGAAPTVK